MLLWLEISLIRCNQKNLLKRKHAETCTHIFEYVHCCTRSMLLVSKIKSHSMSCEWVKNRRNDCSINSKTIFPLHTIQIKTKAFGKDNHARNRTISITWWNNLLKKNKGCILLIEKWNVWFYYENHCFLLSNIIHISKCAINKRIYD